MQPRDDDALLTPSEVAAMFRVNPKTVTRWARSGKISAIRTLGGHRRFRASEIRRFLVRIGKRVRPRIVFDAEVGRVFRGVVQANDRLEFEHLA